MRLKEVIMQRDGMTSEEADELIQEAKETMQKYLAEGDFMAAEDICQDYFGLEPDYLFDLLD